MQTVKNEVSCFFHSGDMDGKCSASIVKKFVPRAKLYGIDYQDIPNFPWHELDKDSLVIMVDFSLPKEDMIRLNEKVSVFYWIDHHKTAIDELEHLEFYGVREVGRAACELTWNFFFGPRPMPMLIRHIGRWDVWDHSDPDTELCHYGLMACDIDINNPNWLDMDFTKILHYGSILRNYQRRIDKEIIKNAYPITIAGYKALAINAPHGSKKFDQYIDKDLYEIYLCYVEVSFRKFRVSLYTERNDIDVGLIAKQYGGGGHKQAAGFVFNIDPKYPFTPWDFK